MCLIHETAKVCRVPLHTVHEKSQLNIDVSAKCFQLYAGG